MLILGWDKSRTTQPIKLALGKVTAGHPWAGQRVLRGQDWGTWGQALLGFTPARAQLPAGGVLSSCPGLCIRGISGTPTPSRSFSAPQCPAAVPTQMLPRAAPVPAPSSLLPSQGQQAAPRRETSHSSKLAPRATQPRLSPACPVKPGGCSCPGPQL